MSGKGRISQGPRIAARSNPKRTKAESLKKDWTQKEKGIRVSGEGSESKPARLQSQKVESLKKTGHQKEKELRLEKAKRYQAVSRESAPYPNRY